MAPRPGPRLLRRVTQGLCAGLERQGGILLLLLLDHDSRDPRASLDFDIARTIPQHLEIMREILD